MSWTEVRWKNYLNTGIYQIFNQDGKLGLKYKHYVLLEPKYSSLSITNDDIPLSDPRVKKIFLDTYRFMEEWNFPIVHADGKDGLVNGGMRRFELELKYDAIIKLAYNFYLGLEHDTYTLYKFFSGRPRIAAQFCKSEKVDLPALLDILKAEHSKAYAQLSKSLYWKNGHYFSKFWQYQGSTFDPDNTHWGYFTVATRKAIMSTNFEITPLELVWAKGI